MRAMLSTVAGVMMALSAAHAQQQQQVNVQLDSLRLEHVDHQQVQAELVMSATAPKGWYLDRIEVGQLLMNGLPFFADPIEAGIKTTGNSFVLPPIHLHFYLKDIQKVGGLEQMLQEQQTSISAVATVSVRANLLQRIFLGEAHPVLMWEIRRTVPVHLGDGFMERMASRLLIAGIDLTHPLAGMFRRGVSDSAESGNEVAVEHTCWITAQAEHHCTQALAFISGSRYLTAVQAVEPWRFDPLLRSLAPVDSSSVERTLEADGVSMQVAARILGTPRTVRVLSMPDRSWISYADNESREVYAELQPLQPIPHALVPTSMNDVACGAVSWQNARVYRLAQDGRGISSVQLMVRLENGSLHFSRPLDQSTAGSPIIGADGVIGVVQSEHAGTVIEPRGDCPAR